MGRLFEGCLIGSDSRTVPRGRKNMGTNEDFDRWTYDRLVGRPIRTGSQRRQLTLRKPLLCPDLPAVPTADEPGPHTVREGTMRSPREHLQAPHCPYNPPRPDSLR